MIARLPFLQLLLALAVFSALLTSKPAYAATEKQASNYIANISDQVIGVIKNKANNKKQKTKALSGIFVTSVDFPWVARFVMGRFWRDASETQRTRYVDLYQRFLVQHYASLFADYSGASYKITAARKVGELLQGEAELTKQLYKNCVALHGPW